jgi:hypothetical protein
MTVTVVEIRFYQKFGDHAHEVRRETFEMEGVTREDISDEAGGLKRETLSLLLALAGITWEEYEDLSDYETVKFEEYTRE